MNNEEFLKELNPIFQALEMVMRKHGLKNIRIWKGSILQEVVANNGMASRHIVFQKRAGREWEEMKKAR